MDSRLSKRASRFLSQSDPRLASVISQVGPVKIEFDPHETVFEALATSIIFQQLHGKAAATICGRFRALFCAAKVGAAPDAELPFPDPKAVIKATTEKLRSAGLSGTKAAAIQDLAQKYLAGLIPDRETAEKMSDAKLIERITTVKGIGRWTVEMFLMFTLGRPDVFPVADYGVRKGYAAVFKKRELPTPVAFEKIGERFKPYRSAAAWYFWRALELPEFAPKRRKKPRSS